MRNFQSFPGDAFVRVEVGEDGDIFVSCLNYGTGTCIALDQRGARDLGFYLMNVASAKNLADSLDLKVRSEEP